jgi:acetyl esterase/lipase
MNAAKSNVTILRGRGATHSGQASVVAAAMIFFALSARGDRAIANEPPSETERSVPRAPGVLPVPDFDEVVYATVGGQPLRLDLYLPSTGEGPFPLAVFIHGGGWSSGTHQNPPRKFALPLLEAGVALASVQYRLTSEAANWGGEPVVFPAQIHDVKGAIRHLRANAATYGIDPARVAVFGSSAGAHLAALLASSGGVASLEGDVGGNGAFASDVIACATISAPTDLLNSQPDFTDPPGSSFDHDLPNSPESRLLGFDGPGEGLGVLRANLGNPADPFPFFAQLAADCSPNTHVDADDPPFFIVHGELDRTVAYKQAERLRDALDAAGVANVFILDPTLEHVQTTPEIDADLVAFLVEALAAPTESGPAGVVAR